MVRWLACQVTPGMLKDEFAVLIRTTGGDLSLFVSAEQLAVDRVPTPDVPVEGRIPVVVLGQDDHHSLVSLPAESVEGPRFAKVARHLLTAA